MDNFSAQVMIANLLLSGNLPW